MNNAYKEKRINSAKAGWTAGLIGPVAGQIEYVLNEKKNEEIDRRNEQLSHDISASLAPLYLNVREAGEEKIKNIRYEISKLESEIRSINRQLGDNEEKLVLNKKLLWIVGAVVISVIILIFLISSLISSSNKKAQAEYDEKCAETYILHIDKSIDAFLCGDENYISLKIPDEESELLLSESKSKKYIYNREYIDTRIKEELDERILYFYENKKGGDLVKVLAELAEKSYYDDQWGAYLEEIWNTLDIDKKIEFNLVRKNILHHINIRH
ncbi:MAG: hypothetical protein Q4C42_03060 [Clostridia bacterium]|nr:hypothetical protein [Clostridia bacterium]